RNDWKGRSEALDIAFFAGFFLLPCGVCRCCGGLFATTQPRARTGKIVLQHNPPESGQIAESGGMSALCQKRTHAAQQKNLLTRTPPRTPQNPDPPWPFSACHPPSFWDKQL